MATTTCACWAPTTKPTRPSAIQFSVVPNEWNEDRRTIHSGNSITGNLCWSVPTDELPYLRMFDHESTNTGAADLYWWLRRSGAPRNRKLHS